MGKKVVTILWLILFIWTYVIFQINNLGPVIRNIMFSVGKYKMESLPGFLQPTKKLMNMVSAFYEKVKGDVLQFYYVSSIRPNKKKVCFG